MELVSGRPQNTEGRLGKEIRTYDFLDSIGIHYERVDHKPAMTIEACEEVDKILGAVICKNLFLCNRQETDFYLLLMPGDKSSKQRIFQLRSIPQGFSFAKPEYMEQFLDITPGSASILGLMNDRDNRVQLLIDEDVLKGEYIGCHPCINTSSLRISTKDMTEKIIPELKHNPKLVRLP